MNQQDMQPTQFIRIDEITLNLDQSEDMLPAKIADILSIDPSRITKIKLVKRSLDSRKKGHIVFVYAADVQITDMAACLEPLHKNANSSASAKLKRHKVRIQEPYLYPIRVVPDGRMTKPPIVVGTGPAGLFAALLLANAGLKPFVVERGKDVDSRVQDVTTFFASGRLNNESNVLFGEGGAGTFSDGKLYTQIHNPKTKFIFEELVAAGASQDILIDAHPHIGTDKLRLVVRNIRQKIIALGGSVNFNMCLTDVEMDNGRMVAAVFNNGQRIETNELVLAIGHSARDTYQLVYDRQLAIRPKQFAIGLRIEHLAEMINKAQYGKQYQHPKLPVSIYKCVAHLPHRRSVYSFCMCPGGYVIASASEDNMLVTNGMSESSRNSRNSNSALLVSVGPQDFGSDHPLAGVEFQRQWENRAFIAGGGGYRAPAQLVGDFLEQKPSKKTGSVAPTYKPGVTLTSLDNCLPDYVLHAIREALPVFDQKIKGFASRDALLTGVETRSSAPVKLIRNACYESSIKGIYPAGEGSGHAGGIVSSALDGLAVAESIINKYLKTGTGASG